MGLSITVLPTLQILPTFQIQILSILYLPYLHLQIKDKVGNTAFLRKGK